MRARVMAERTSVRVYVRREFISLVRQQTRIETAVGHREVCERPIEDSTVIDISGFLFNEDLSASRLGYETLSPMSDGYVAAQRNSEDLRVTSS